MSKPITFTAENLKKLYYNEEYDEDREGRFDGPKGYEGWYIEADSSTGKFDAEKGSMYDYDIHLYNDKDEYMGSATGGYYNAIAGHRFNYELTFYPPAPKTKKDEFNEFLLEVANEGGSLKSKISKVEKYIESIK